MHMLWMCHHHHHSQFECQILKSTRVLPIHYTLSTESAAATESIQLVN